MTEEFRVKAGTVLEVAQKVAFPVLLGVAGWTFTAISDHEARITRIEATRYTQREADQDRARAAEERAEMASQLAVYASSTNETSRRLARLEDKIDTLIAALGKR